MNDLSSANTQSPGQEHSAVSGADELVTRNVRIGPHRTSIRLEPTMWAAFDEVVQREGTSPHELCTLIAEDKRFPNFTSAVRVFLLEYFRSAATASGHVKAGHGRTVTATLRSRLEGTPRPSYPSTRIRR